MRPQNGVSKHTNRWLHVLRTNIETVVRSRSTDHDQNHTSARQNPLAIAFVANGKKPSSLTHAFRTAVACSWYPSNTSHVACGWRLSGDRSAKAPRLPPRPRAAMTQCIQSSASHHSTFHASKHHPHSQSPASSSPAQTRPPPAHCRPRTSLPLAGPSPQAPCPRHSHLLSRLRHGLRRRLRRVPRARKPRLRR